MCHFQTLYHDDQTGYVVRCPECDKIQIAYANLMITFNLEDFSPFRNWLKRIGQDQLPDLDQTTRSILIPTPCEGMKLLLSPRELTEFDNMLEKADDELRSIELLNLFVDK